MINGGQELPPRPYIPGLISKEELPHLDQWAIAPRLQFEPEILAQGKWQEMLSATQDHLTERGIVIGFGGKKLHESKIITGTEDRVVLPNLPFGIRSLGRIDEIAVFHTHPKPEDLNHIPTTIFSDLDINAILGSRLKALGMLDTGGVHLLLRKPNSSHFADPELDKPIEVVQQAIDTAVSDTRLIGQARLETAKKLRELGIAYYYSPTITLNEHGLVEVRDVLSKDN